MKTPIDWASMPLDEQIRELEAGREDAARKAQRLLAAAGLAPEAKRGRPSIDPFARLRSTEQENEDAAAAAQ